MKPLFTIIYINWALATCATKHCKHFLLWYYSDKLQYGHNITHSLVARKLYSTVSWSVLMQYCTVLICWQRWQFWTVQKKPVAKFSLFSIHKMPVTNYQLSHRCGVVPSYSWLLLDIWRYGYDNTSIMPLPVFQLVRLRQSKWQSLLVPKPPLALHKI